MDIIKICNLSEVKIVKLPNLIKTHCDKITDKKQQIQSKKVWSLLSKYLDLNNVYFSKNSKPLSKVKNQFFNLSHSNDKIAIAISNKAIGIDIQKIINAKLCDRIANKYLNKNNLAKYKKSKNPQLWFTKLWTGLESYTKLFDCNLDPKQLNRKLNCSIKYRKVNNYIFAIAKK